MEIKNKIFTAPGTISKIITMEDRVLRLQIDCQEMKAEDEVVILKSRGTLGYFMFCESVITDDDVKNIKLPDYAPTEKDDKTPSKRLRAVLYLLWEKKGKKDIYGNTCDSDTYYKQIMETLIGQYKEKLD